MDRKIRYFVNGWSFRLSFATRPGYDGDHEDISEENSYELADTENSEERSRRRKHSYRRMGTRSMTRKMASAPSSTGL